MPLTTVSIPKRFNGPPEFGNGGYGAGLVAAQLGRGVAVRLVRPLPLETDLTVSEGEGRWEVHAGDTLIATATPSEPHAEPPAPPSYDEARALAAQFEATPNSRFSRCFVCGVERPEGDGLRIFAGRSAPHAVAAPWLPTRALTGGARVPTELIWAALDCPGYFATFDDGRYALLGELSVRIDAPIESEAPYVITGWMIEQSGRKRRAGTALFDRDGACRALGVATWIEIPA